MADAPRRIRIAAERLASHPQDHGWRELYRLIAYNLSGSAGGMATVADISCRCRPESSDVHLVTLIGIAIKSAVPAMHFEALIMPGPLPERSDLLNELLNLFARRITDIVGIRHNSFTNARRFLVPQVVMAAYFRTGDIAKVLDTQVRFADVGTGLGIMPKQLNNPHAYYRFAFDLAWPGGTPRFQAVPIQARFGVDKEPPIDSSWVKSCYGASNYYSHMFAEVTAFRGDTTPVEYHQLDMLDSGCLSEFISRNSINAVNLCYTLYEVQPELRENVLDALRSALLPPGLIVVIEPRAELTRSGCTVELYDDHSARPRELLEISDGHFIGHARPGRDYSWFNDNYPIPYHARSGRAPA